MKNFRRCLTEILIEKGFITFPHNMKYIAEDLGMNIKEIKWFRPDGKNHAPNGEATFNGMMYKSIQENENSFIRNTNSKLFENFVDEGVSDYQSSLSKYKGGMIVFALNVNAVVDKEVDTSDLKKSFKKVFYTVKNYLFKSKMLNSLIKKHNDEYNNAEEFSIGAITIGNNFTGRYFSEDGAVFNEKSSSIEIGGISSEVLILFAIALCKEFRQETVLVKDFNINKIFYVDSKGIDEETPKQRMSNATKEIEKAKKLNSETV